MNAIKEHEVLNKYTKMSGLAFFVENIEDMILNFDSLERNYNKEKYIKKLLDRNLNLTYSGMIMRVNGMIKIIELGYVNHALAKAANSPRLDNKTKNHARTILEKLTGKEV